jgi:mannose/fructose/N-acetylgalactosamine-specific phosphotransferase system component IIC
MTESKALLVALPAFVLIGIGAGALSSNLTKRLRHFNELFLRRAAQGIDSGRIGAIWRNHLLALLPMFAKSFSIMAVSILAGWLLLVPLMLRLDRIDDTRAIVAITSSLLAAGVGIGVRATAERHWLWFVLCSTAWAAVILLSGLSGPLAMAAIILGCLLITLLWQRLRPSEQQ